MGGFPGRAEPGAVVPASCPRKLRDPPGLGHRVTIPPLPRVGVLGHGTFCVGPGTTGHTAHAPREVGGGPFLLPGLAAPK